MHRWSPTARVVLICRLVVRDLRHRPAQAVLLLVAITTAAATLTLGLVLNGVTSQPYLRTQAATNGPDVVASVLPQLSGTQLAPLPASALPQLTALDRAPGVTAHSGPYPVASAVLRAHGHAVPVQAEGRNAAAAAVDQPALTQGGWVRPGGVVLERTFAEALGVRVGDLVTLNGRSFRVAGLAVTTATPEYPQVCYYLTCNSYGQASESAMGLVWVTVSTADSLATRSMPLAYQLNLRLSDPASAAAFVSAHGSADPSAPQLLSWQQISTADNDLVSVAQQVLTPGAWLAVALAVASVAVLAGGRMTEQTRRVGQLKAVGAAPATVAAVLLAEHLIVASVAAAAGLMTGLLVAPLLSDAGAGLVGSPGAPALTLGTVGQVVAVALGVTLAATLVPAFRAARTSTASALADSPRPPRRWAMLIAISAWLPVPLLIGLRLVARRPRRAFLSAASTAITVTGIVAVLAAHHANDVADRRFDWFAGLTRPGRRPGKPGDGGAHGHRCLPGGGQRDRHRLGDGARRQAPVGALPRAGRHRAAGHRGPFGGPGAARAARRPHRRAAGHRVVPRRQQRRNPVRTARLVAGRRRARHPGRGRPAYRRPGQVRRKPAGSRDPPSRNGLTA